MEPGANPGFPDSDMKEWGTEERSNRSAQVARRRKGKERKGGREEEEGVEEGWRGHQWKVINFANLPNLSLLHRRGGSIGTERRREEIKTNRPPKQTTGSHTQTHLIKTTLIKGTGVWNAGLTAIPFFNLAFQLKNRNSFPRFNSFNNYICTTVRLPWFSPEMKNRLVMKHTGLQTVHINRNTVLFCIILCTK